MRMGMGRGRTATATRNSARGETLVQGSVGMTVIVRDILIVVLIVLTLTRMHILLALEYALEQAGLFLVMVSVVVGVCAFVGLIGSCKTARTLARACIASGDALVMVLFSFIGGAPNSGCSCTTNGGIATVVMLAVRADGGICRLASDSRVGHRMAGIVWIGSMSSLGCACARSD